MLLSGVIVLLSKKLPLTFLLLHMFWKFMPSIFAYLKKIFICPLIFWKTYLLVTVGWVYLSFPSAFSIDVGVRTVRPWAGFGLCCTYPQRTTGFKFCPQSLWLRVGPSLLEVAQGGDQFIISQCQLCLQLSVFPFHWTFVKFASSVPELQSLLMVCWAPTD